MKHRVCIGTCSGPAEAAFVRSVFDAHDVPVVINGEMHANAMGGLAGFVRLEIFVDRDDAERATTLLRDIRAGENADGAEADGPVDEVVERDSDERADAAGVWEAKQPAHALEVADEGSSSMAGFDTRRRSTGAVLLLSVLLGFGTGHMSTGAWGRGAILAALNVLAFAGLGKDPAFAGWLLFAVRFVDMFGALWRVWSKDPRASAS